MNYLLSRKALRKNKTLPVELKNNTIIMNPFLKYQTRNRKSKIKKIKVKPPVIITDKNFYNFITRSSLVYFLSGSKIDLSFLDNYDYNPNIFLEVRYIHINHNSKTVTRIDFKDKSSIDKNHKKWGIAKIHSLSCLSFVFNTTKKLDFTDICIAMFYNMIPNDKKIFGLLQPHMIYYKNRKTNEISFPPKFTNKNCDYIKALKECYECIYYFVRQQLKFIPQEEHKLLKEVKYQVLKRIKTQKAENVKISHFIATFIWQSCITNSLDIQAYVSFVEKLNIAKYAKVSFENSISVENIFDPKEQLSLSRYYDKIKYKRNSDNDDSLNKLVYNRISQKETDELKKKIQLILYKYIPFLDTSEIATTM